MKKIYTLFSIIALTVLAAGCAKELQDPNAAIDNVIAVDETTGESIVTVALSVPESSDTKTTLGDKDGDSYPVLWSAGDVIKLNGTAATEFTPASGNATATAKFKVNNLAAPYNFLYNGSGTNQVSFPSTQNYVAGGFDPAAMPMYASVTDLTAGVAFSHVGALLKFSFTGSKKIDTINLSAADANASLSGNFTIGATAGLLNGTLTPAAGGAGLIYSFGGHMQLSETPFVFYIAIPAGTYEGGITLDVIDNDSGHMTVTVMDSNATKTIAAGKVREFDNVTYIPNKEVNLKQIYNDATFLEFVNAVAGGQKTLNARLTQGAATLSLSAATISAFNSIEDYKGTFDGNGKTISGLTKPLFATLKGVVKNLTLNSTINETAAGEYHWGMFAKQIIPSSEVDDLPGLQNCTAQGSITWTPSSAISSMMTLGGLVGNNKGGTISGCTNEATVTFANNGTTNENQPSIGGVVGRTQKGGEGLTYQGDISNCTNSGTVICAANFSQNIYIGGVLGYQVEKAETMSGCVNHGLVKVASTASTGQALQLGGVVGLARGTMENCTNASDGVVTSEACSVSSYLCQGGVVGRLNGSYTYETLTNAGTVNVAATGGSSGRLIGGVVGRCNEGATLDGVTNSGNINYTAEATNDTYIGGVVAHNDKADIILQNCSSTGGTLTVSNASHSGGLYVGGVVGYSTKAVISCSNAMTIATSGSMIQGSNSYLCFGGVIGYMSGAALVTTCTNSGAINFGQAQSAEGQLYIGGVAGAVTGAEIYGGGNSGTITFSGQNTKRPPSVGGIVGRVFSNTTDSGYSLNNNVTNSGSIIFNSSVSSSQYMYAGGLVGQHLGGNIYGTNDAPITVTELHESMMALGGIVGYLAGGTVSNGTNTANGDIALNGFISGYHSYTGGIVGMASGGSSIAAGGGTITGASNAGDITIGSGCAIPRNNYVGGVIAYAGNTVSGASNTGNIVNNYSQTDSSDGSYHFNIAGVAGMSAAALSSCYNTGNVTNNGTTYQSEINLAGVVGMCNGDLTSCYNEGTITNYATSGTSSKQDNQTAGVVANNRGYTLTSCYNTGSVTNSGNGNTLSVGGLVAWSNANSSLVECYNTGSISNFGAGGYTTANKKWDAATFCVRLGGLIGCAKGANTIAGTSGSYNYNNGTVTESSTSKYVAVGGVCGWADNASTDFAYCRNNADGDIFIKNNERINVVVGGILGMAKDASIQVSYTRNAGTIEFESLSFPSSGANQGIFAGGILGVNTVAADPTVTITHCYNEGNIQNHTQNWSSTDLLTSYKSIGYSYVGGIAGAGDKTGYKYEYCYSRGDIYIYSNLKMRVGGIAAYSNIAPENCAVYSDVYYFRQYNKAGYGQEAGAITTSTGGDMGGIIGYCNTAGPFKNLTFYGGTLISRGSSPAAYGGGILGNAKQGGTFENCNVAGGTLSGSGSNSTGLFCSSSAEDYAFTFSSCVVKSSTKHVGANTVTISSASDLTAVRLFGTNEGTYTGDVTVGSVTNPLANGCPFD